MNIESILEVKPNPSIPALNPGDTIKVHTKIIEGDKERTQVFQGVVIRVRPGGAGASFTVRRVSYGIGVERTFPIYSPLVEKVEVVRHGKVRRAKLYYLRQLSGKASRIKEKRAAAGKAEELVAEPSEEAQESAPAAAELAEPPPAETAAPPAAEGAKPPVAEVAQPPAAQATEPKAAPTSEPKKE